MSQQVHAPYHFVPLSKWVYMPDWAHLVSHDHPFEDGHSGVIEYTLTNKTPLCVGDTKDANGVLKFARDPMGNPVIPGSSLKGMIRNVLEIASFGKFNAVDNQRFSYRDFNDNNYKSLLTSKADKYAKLSKSGWLKFEEGKWLLSLCPYHVVFNNTLNDYYDPKIKIVNETSDKKNHKKEQTVVEKYGSLPLNGKEGRVNFEIVKQKIEGTKGKEIDIKCAQLGQGDKLGVPVFVGFRPGKQKYRHTRLSFSYLFEEPKQEFIEVDSKIVKSLFSNHNKDTIGYLKNNPHCEFGIPVFAIYDDNKLHSLGLSQMPRVTYKHSTEDLIENQSKAHTSDAYFDMAELMFGTLRDSGLGLKSRVTFSDAVIDKSTYQEKTSIYQARPTVLASPKATFLGGYLEQDSADKYRSYDDENAKVSGWKRYPARKGYEHHEPSNDNAGSQSKFELLMPDHSFTGRIVFHNLKSEELSALIWCLTLNNSSFNQHSLGHAKPLGAGGVVIKLSETSRIHNYHGKSLEINASEYSERFTKHMNTRYDPQGKWEFTPQIKHLLALTDEDIENYNEFSYQELKVFQKIKNDKAALPGLEISGETLSIQPLDNGLQGSNSFVRGRLSSLFDKEDKFHQEQCELSDAYQTKLEDRDKKQQLANEKAALNEMDLPPYEKSEKLLQFIVDSQDELTSTERKSKTKELRDIFKVIKEIKLEPEKAELLLSLYGKITLSDKETSKAIKHLEKLHQPEH